MRLIPLRHARLWEPPEPPAAPAVVYLDGHTDIVRAVSASPDGKYLVSAGTDGRVIIRPVERPNEARVIGPSANMRYECLAISRDSQFALASGHLNFVGSNSPIEKISLADGRVEQLKLPEASHVWHLFLCDNDSKVAYVGRFANEETIRLAELATGRDLGRWPVFVGAVPAGKVVFYSHTYALSPDGRHVAIAAGKSPVSRLVPYKLSVLEMDGNRRLISERDPFQQGRAVLPHFPDANTLDFYLPSGTVRRWTYSPDGGVWLEHDTRPFPPLRIGEPFTRPLTPTGDTIWLGLDHLLIGLDAATGRATTTILLRPPPGSESNAAQPITAVTPIPHTTQLAVGLWNGRVAIVDTARRQP